MDPFADDLNPSPANREILTVSQLNHEARDLLEAEFPAIWVEGEISNLARPASGHIYFSLKDERCQVRAAMFRNRNGVLDFRPENGTQVLVRARVSLYPNRGDFQLIVESMEESGEGALRRAFEALKKRLDAEGLFSSEHKQPLPLLPAQIGVITSPSGAAIRDILSVLKRRFPSIPVVIYPVPVQGEGAGQKIASMIATADERDECDVIIVTRGGGSLEDLWAFNEEVVARAIYAARTPIVSGVGHEVDFTITDFVADQRAPTPSAAAELVTPDRREWQQRFIGLTNRMQLLITAEIKWRRERTDWLKGRILHPRRHLENLTQRVDDTAVRLVRAMKARLSVEHAAATTLNARLARHDPAQMLKLHRSHCQQLAQRFENAAVQMLRQRQTHIADLSRTFRAVSPQQTLDRGYAIVTERHSKRIVRAGTELTAGDVIDARLATGVVSARVIEPES